MDPASGGGIQQMIFIRLLNFFGGFWGLFLHSNESKMVGWRIGQFEDVFRVEHRDFPAMLDDQLEVSFLHWYQENSSIAQWEGSSVGRLVVSGWERIIPPFLDKRWNLGELQHFTHLHWRGNHYSPVNKIYGNKKAFFQTSQKKTKNALIFYGFIIKFIPGRPTQKSLPQRKRPSEPSFFSTPRSIRIRGGSQIPTSRQSLRLAAWVGGLEDCFTNRHFVGVYHHLNKNIIIFGMVKKRPQNHTFSWDLCRSFKTGADFLMSSFYWGLGIFPQRITQVQPFRKEKQIVKRNTSSKFNSSPLKMMLGRQLFRGELLNFGMATRTWTFP